MSQTAFLISPTSIPGCLEIRPRIHKDHRGHLIKVFQKEAFREMGLCTDFSEDFYSVSRHGVLRGLHFQAPPADHVKLVYCVDGVIQDAVLDLRCDSPTFRRHALVRLSAEEGNMLYIPRGLAHGFCTLSETAIVAYKTSSSHSSEHDRGVLWNSAGIPWAEKSPQVSERDRTLPPLESFQSPFTYAPME
jgi:dTDP-4-dehydrorhamnose 3,5-epimerase